jgi:cation diffusion facilitator family transporter
VEAATVADPATPADATPLTYAAAPWAIDRAARDETDVAAPAVAGDRRGLLVSIAITAVLGAIGIVWGIASGSQMILLDGAFAVVGILVSWLLLGAAELSGREPNRRYPFGREAATPLAIGVQGFVLLATLAYAAYEAALTINAGGSELDAGWAVLYGVLTTVASLGTWWWLRRAAGHSDVLRAEATAWKVAALRGVGMVVGFSILLVVQGSSIDGAAPYIDPVMVLVTCVAFAPAPIRMVRGTLVELLEGAPDDELLAAVRAAVDEAAQDFPLDHPQIRATKVGPKLYVELVAEVDPDVTIAQQQTVYDDLLRRLDRLPYDVWLNVELTPRRESAPPG